MSERTVTLVGNVRNIKREAKSGTVRIKMTSAPFKEDTNLIIPGTAVVQLDDAGDFALTLGAGSYTLSLNNEDEVDFVLTGPWPGGTTITLTSLLT
jgi:hypothetical protein